MMRDKNRAFTGEMDLHAVNDADDNLSAADRGAGDFMGFSISGSNHEFYGVGVSVFAQISGDEFIADAFLFRQFKGLTKAFIKRVQVQKAGKEGFVGTMAAIVVY